MAIVPRCSVCSGMFRGIPRQVAAKLATRLFSKEAWVAPVRVRPLLVEVLDRPSGELHVGLDHVFGQAVPGVCVQGAVTRPAISESIDNWRTSSRIQLPAFPGKAEELLHRVLDPVHIRQRELPPFVNSLIPGSRGISRETVYQYLRVESEPMPEPIPGCMTCRISFP
jgi:hypothetical protein